MKDQIKKTRAGLKESNQALFLNRNRLQAKETALSAAKKSGRQGEDRIPILEREIRNLQALIVRNKGQRIDLRDELSGLVNKFVLPKTTQELVSELGDNRPFLLLPLRIETRFTGESENRKLLLRVYPDDIAVHSHEKELTRDEADASIQYWIERHQASGAAPASEKELLEKGAWRALVNAYGGTRASWVAKEIRRSIIEKQGNEDLSFLEIASQFSAILNNEISSQTEKASTIELVLAGTNPVIPELLTGVNEIVSNGDLNSDAAKQEIMQVVRDALLSYLGFELDSLKPESWSRPPYSTMMPDRFVLIGSTNGVDMERPFPFTVPNPLILGPDPQENGLDFQQENGDLISGLDFAWVANFELAIETGMAMRIPLVEPFASRGFDRLMVVGVRLSSEPEDHALAM